MREDHNPSQDHAHKASDVLDHLRLGNTALNTMLTEIGGCSDGNCIVLKPQGQHTNGGCRCWKDQMKMQRYARAHNMFAQFVANALSRTIQVERESSRDEH